ncbi:threonine aldolase family protein [Leptolyngbya iicbica]|uniref:Aminotransferase class I/II-fold pyridoxal phosphate-dependent enzyme n=3 Tax=Cyanophyceae TaxID=3028117 RepID=A0A4Q7E089_9CYAN|nr:aminotransferase class I/II-fold pyridoxal phosphate-dependent enzyme [Leptolyngbya sp. LK]
MIDLRSDTVTQPTPAMRQVIADAPVGDDVLGDDPTVNELEETVAELLGKEAAVYMPSGTMTNQVALRIHTEPGDEIILESQAHIYFYEAGGPAALSGVMCKLITGDRGIFTAADLQAALRPWNEHYPRTKLVCLENTHNRGGGSIFPLSEIRAIAQVCQANNLRLHLDGARFWNACIATGITEAEYANPFDTVSVCFSKGLGAPVGSALVGSKELMQRARRFRKMFGGGMRQAGIIAAGALYALKHQRDRLTDDHAHAQRLAQGLQAIDGISVDLDTVVTNLVYFHTPPTLPATVLANELAAVGVGVLPTAAHTLRAVTNLMVDQADIDTALEQIAAVMGQLRSQPQTPNPATTPTVAQY